MALAWLWRVELLFTHLCFDPFWNVWKFVPLRVLLLLQVKDIPCGTKGGVMISFEKIEVLSMIWFN